MDNQNNKKKKRNIFLPIFIAIIILIVIITLILFLTGVIDFSELGNDNTSRDETKEVDKKKNDSEDNEDKEESKKNTGSFFTPIRGDIILTTACSNVDLNGEYYMSDSEFTVECKNYVCVADVDGKKYTRNCTEENNNTEESEQSEENNSSEDTEDKLEQENQDEEEKEENSENENPLYTPIRVKIIFDTACANLDPNGEFYMSDNEYTVDCSNFVCVANVDGQKYTRSCLEE